MLITCLLHHVYSSNFNAVVKVVKCSGLISSRDWASRPAVLNYFAFLCYSCLHKLI